MRVCTCIAALLAVTVLPGVSWAVTASFVPDGAIRGASLAGWRTLGAATWKVANGEVTASGQGGWLVSDKQLQDVILFTQLRLAPGSRAGILLRAEKTRSGGLRGIFVSLVPGDTASYVLTLDGAGKEVGRQKLRGNAPGPVPPDPWDNSKLPIQRPDNTLAEGAWNQVEVVAFEGSVRGHINAALAGIQGGPTEDLNYGAFALYAAGGEVRFRDVAWKDLGVRSIPPEQISSRFRMQRLNEFYYAWGTAVADINRDGVPDLVAGPWYYLGPDYTVSREIYLSSTVNPSTEYAMNCMFAFTLDVNGDGWPDVLQSADGRAANLYINPAGQPRRWKKYEVIPKVQSEIALLRDLDGDGKPEFIYAANNHLSLARPDPGDPTKPWLVQQISDASPVGGVSTHGMGVGDINGDGRLDVVQTYGWWEQPATGAKTGRWRYHPEAFGRWARSLPGGGEMGVYDINGDGLVDVITGLEAHGLGLAWFEQKRDATGRISFVRHMIMDDFATKNAGGVTFSELHGSQVADIDGDGVPDFIVGKRYWSHGDTPSDPDAWGAPVVYWYRTVRNPKAPGGAEFVPELIHNRSGVGSQLSAVDLNGDGAVDVITATDRGTFVFWGKVRGGF